MEAKKQRAAAVCVLLLLMLPGQRQKVAAMSEFCECYQQCYAECRHHKPRWACVPLCFNKCTESQTTAGSCRAACAAIKICGMSGPLPEEPDATACARVCGEKWTHKLPT